MARRRFEAMIVAGIVMLVRAWVPRLAAAAADRLARKVDLSLDASVASTVVRRLALRDRAGAVGGILAVAVAVAAVAGRGGPEQVYDPFLVLFAFFVGHAAGYAGAGWWEARRPVPPGAGGLEVL